MEVNMSIAAIIENTFRLFVCDCIFSFSPWFMGEARESLRENKVFIYVGF